MPKAFGIICPLVVGHRPFCENSQILGENVFGDNKHGKISNLF